MEQLVLVRTAMDASEMPRDAEEAVRHYRGMLGGRLDRTARDELVNLLCELGRLTEAEAVCRDGFVASDRHMRRRLVGVLRAQGRVGDAVTVLREAIASRGDAAGAELRCELGDLLAEFGHRDEAAAAYRDAIVLDGEPFVVAHWIEAGDTFGVPVDLVSAYRDAIAAGQHDFVEELVQELLDAGRIDEAYSAYRESPVVLGRGVPAELADLLAERGQRDEAIEVLQAADVGEDVALQLAGLLVAAGRYAEAAVQYLWCDPDEAAAQLEGHPDGGGLLAWWRRACEDPKSKANPETLRSILDRLDRPEPQTDSATRER